MADEIIIRECGEDEGQVVLSLWQQASDVVLSPTDSLEYTIVLRCSWWRIRGPDHGDHHRYLGR